MIKNYYINVILDEYKSKKIFIKLSYLLFISLVLVILHLKLYPF